MEMYVMNKGSAHCLYVIAKSHLSVIYMEILRLKCVIFLLFFTLFVSLCFSAPSPVVLVAGHARCYVWMIKARKYQPSNALNTTDLMPSVAATRDHVRSISLN